MFAHLIVLDNNRVPATFVAVQSTLAEQGIDSMFREWGDASCVPFGFDDIGSKHQLVQKPDLVVVDGSHIGIDDAIETLRSDKDEGSHCPVFFVASVGTLANYAERLAQVGVTSLVPETATTQPARCILQFYKNIMAIQGAATPALADKISWNDIFHYMPDTMFIEGPAGKRKLARSEVHIMNILTSAPRFFNREALSRVETDRDNMRNIDSHIKRLRKKIEAVGIDPTCIRTEYGEGYIFDVEAIVSNAGRPVMQRGGRKKVAATALAS